MPLPSVSGPGPSVSGPGPSVSGPGRPGDDEEGDRARASARRIRHSRVLSYVLAALGVVTLSFAPSVLGDPSTEGWRVVLHVVRPVVAAVLIVAALAVQVVVGLRWRRDLVRPRSEGVPARPAGATDPDAPPRV